MAHQQQQYKYYSSLDARQCLDLLFRQQQAFSRPIPDWGEIGTLRTQMQQVITSSLVLSPRIGLFQLLQKDHHLCEEIQLVENTLRTLSYDLMSLEDQVEDRQEAYRKQQHVAQDYRRALLPGSIPDTWTPTEQLIERRQNIWGVLLLVFLAVIGFCYMMLGLWTAVIVGLVVGFLLLKVWEHSTRGLSSLHRQAQEERSAVLSYYREEGKDAISELRHIQDQIELNKRQQQDLGRRRRWLCEELGHVAEALERQLLKF
jgi:hypothetical protein